MRLNQDSIIKEKKNPNYFQVWVEQINCFRDDCILIKFNYSKRWAILSLHFPFKSGFSPATGSFVLFLVYMLEIIIISMKSVVLGLNWMNLGPCYNTWNDTLLLYTMELGFHLKCINQDNIQTYWLKKKKKIWLCKSFVCSWCLRWQYIMPNIWLCGTTVSSHTCNKLS